MTRSDPARVRSVSSGDSRFVEIYNSYFREVYAYCRRRTDPGRVDDAVADTFLVCWRRIDRVPGEPKTLPWLYGVAYKVIGQQWRGTSRQKKLRRRLHEVGVEPVATTDDVILVRDEAQILSKAFTKLRPDDQEVLRLSIWEELPYPELSDVLQISQEAVRQRLSRARKRLTNEYNRLEKTRSSDTQRGGAW